MIYEKIKEGIFISRPNRFIATVQVDGEVQICHVKNTGRCKELLIEGVKVILSVCPSPSRKTAYDLIAVYKNGVLINIDSQAPNKVVEEWLRAGNYFQNITLLRPEYTYGSSRFDFYIETDTDKILVEVKGVTLEEKGVVMFPDAPTERGVKHIKELMSAAQRGYKTHLFFIIQMDSCKYFTPNSKTHKAFADALKVASAQGVTVTALTCHTTPNSLTVSHKAPIVL